MLSKAVISSHSPRLGIECAQQKPWVGANLFRGLGGAEEPGKGMARSQDSGRLARLMLKGRTEAPQPGHRGPVVSADLVGVWRAGVGRGASVESMSGAESPCSGLVVKACQCLRCEDSACHWVRIM